MSFWDNLFSKKEDPYQNTREQVKERLRVIVESDKHLSRRLTPETINAMKHEIMDIVRKYVHGVSSDDVVVALRNEGDKEMLEMNINL